MGTREGAFGGESIYVVSPGTKRIAHVAAKGLLKACPALQYLALDQRTRGGREGGRKGEEEGGERGRRKGEGEGERQREMARVYRMRGRESKRI